MAAVALATVMGAAALGVAGQVDFAKVSRLSKPAALNEQAPAVYKARFETSKGAFVVEVTRAWAPIGADRFYNLVKNGFYDDVRFTRVIPGFMVQFGINGNPTVTRAWKSVPPLKDDPVKQSNVPAYISFATAGPNSRTTQVFINYGNNARLDAMGFAPFGRVIEGMAVVSQLNSEYGERPDQFEIEARGNGYLSRDFARLDFIRTATIVN
jgi:peptidyl-prolyl cis-trans isomerase A (cyclophilin A)